MEQGDRPGSEARVHIPALLGAKSPAGKRNSGMGCCGLPIWVESDDRPRGMRMTCQVLRVCCQCCAHAGPPGALTVQAATDYCLAERKSGGGRQKLWSHRACSTSGLPNQSGLCLCRACATKSGTAPTSVSG